MELGPNKLPKFVLVVVKVLQKPNNRISKFFKGRVEVAINDFFP